MADLAPGDIALVGFSTEGSTAATDTFAFVATVAIAAGTVIYFTDNGWTAAGAFRTGEGILTYTVPAGGLTAARVTTAAP